MRSAKVLLAYVNEQEAANYLKNGQRHLGADVSREIERWRQARTALTQGPPRPPEDVCLRDLPPELVPLADAVANTPDFQMLMGSLQTSFGILRLPRLLSFQPAVYTEAEERVREVKPGDLGSIAAVTLPLPRKAEVSLKIDEAQSAYLITSDDPNLRIGGTIQADVSTAVGPKSVPMQMKALGYHVTRGSQWMQAVCFQDRWFLRDGYHRAYALLEKGIEEVPCVLLYARSLQELYGDRSGFIAYDLLFGDRPARVADFLTGYGVEIFLPKLRKVIRIRPDEFLIPE